MIVAPGGGWVILEVAKRLGLVTTKEMEEQRKTVRSLQVVPYTPLPANREGSNV